MIHQYQLNGYNIVLDVNSGGVHVVDDITYEMIQMLTPPLRGACPKDVADRLSEKYTKQEIA